MNKLFAFRAFCGVLRVVGLRSLLAMGARSLMVCSLGPGLLAQTDVASLRIAEELTPPGGIAQVKVELTEPRPIIIVKSNVRSANSGAQSRRFSIPVRALGGGLLGPVQGARAFSASGNLAGAATIVGDEIRLQILSPDGQFGLVPDTPLVVFTAPVSASAAPGATATLSLDLGSMEIRKPDGQSYGTESKPGTLRVGGVSIDRVLVSGDFVAAGTELVIRGSGFVQGGDLDINEVDTVSVRVVNSTEVRAVVQQSFSLYGRRIRWRNPGNDEDEFFPVSGTPTAPPGTHPLIAATFPLFGEAANTAARIAFPAARVPGLALENPSATPATVTIRGFQGSASTAFQATRTLTAGGTHVEDLATLFGTANHGLSAVQLESAQPIRVLGLAADTAQSVVEPIAATSATPVNIALNAAVSGASFTGGGIAPGEIVSLFGGPFLSPSASATGLPLPQQLGGISVTINDLPAPLFFVGQGQINCLAPLELTGDTVVVRVRVQGVVQATLSVPRRAVSPAIFTFDFSGGGPGVLAENSTGRVATPATPLKVGEFAVIYCTGLGAVTNPPATGSGAPALPLSNTVVVPTVRIGGVNVPVLFSGLSPGFAGLYQVNVPISADLPKGSAVPVQIAIGGVSSNTVTTAIE
jgi:uncharacterized protein (TIGR03437 family)